jgi:hypothetical protein
MSNIQTIEINGEFSFYVASDGNCGPIYDSIVVFDMETIPTEYDDEFTELLETENYFGIIDFLLKHNIKATIIR